MDDNTPAARAAALNMPYVDPERLVLLAVKRMAEDFWRTTDDAELKGRIGLAYEKLIGAGIRNFAGDRDSFASMYIKGPPGHGKSSSLIEAAQRFSQMVGLNYHPFPTQDQKLGKNDLVLVTREFTGEVSTLASRGIFEKADRNGSAVTRRVPYEDFVAAREAQLSVGIIDDISSALDTVQTSFLGMIRNRFSEGQSYRNMFIALTGNIGDADGTMVQPGTAALGGRCMMAYLEDDVELFSKRMMRKFGSDDIGDGHVCSYLSHHPDAFSPKASQMIERDQPRPQPRTWEKLAGDMRSIVHIYQQDPNSPLFGDWKSCRGLEGAIRQAASEHIGSAAAAPFASYVQSMMSETFPLAKQIFERGIDRSEHLIARVIERAGRGMRNDGAKSEAAFQFQFAEACAAVAATRIANSPALKGNEREQRQMLRQEIGTFLKVMNMPFMVSRGAGYILMANQSHATATLGRRLCSIPEMAAARKPSDLILSRVSLRTDFVGDALVPAVQDVNEFFREKFGSALYTRDDLMNNVYAPITGDVGAIKAATLPNIDFGEAPTMPMPGTASGAESAAPREEMNHV